MCSPNLESAFSTVNASQCNFTVEDVLGNGDCLFAVLKKALCDYNTPVTLYRFNVVKFVYDNWEEYAESVLQTHGIDDREKYWLSMANTTKYAEMSEIKAASVLFSRPISIWLETKVCNVQRYVVTEINPQYDSDTIYILLKNSDFEHNHFQLMKFFPVVSELPRPEKIPRPATFHVTDTNQIQDSEFEVIKANPLFSKSIEDSSSSQHFSSSLDQLMTQNGSSAVLLPCERECQAEECMQLDSANANSDHITLNHISESERRTRTCDPGSNDEQDLHQECNQEDHLSDTHQENIPMDAGFKKRTRAFQKTEIDIRELCKANGVNYIPPPAQESTNETRSRRKRLRMLCRQDTTSLNNNQQPNKSRQWKKMEEELKNLCESHGTQYLSPKEKESISETRERRRSMRKQFSEIFEIEEEEFPSIEHFIKVSKDFENEQMSYTFSTCSTCREKKLKLKLYKGECSRCYADKNVIKMFSKENKMIPADIPPELDALSIVEEQFIAQVSPIMAIKMIGHGGFVSKGHCVAFAQAIDEPTKILPKLPSEIDVIKAVVGSSSSNNVTSLRIRRYVVWKALIWLKANNPAYGGITISEERLSQLPIDGELRDGVVIDCSTSTCTNRDLGPAPNQVMQDDEEDQPEESYVPLPDPIVNITEQVANAVHDVLGPNAQGTSNGRNTASIPWPSIDETPLSEFTTRYFFTLQYPRLLPNGDGDFNINRPLTCEDMAKWACHLLWLEDGRFAKHPYFKFIVNNVIQRKRVLEKGKFIVRQTLGAEPMSIEGLREILENGNDSLTRAVLHLSADIRGSSQYWLQRQKELRSLVHYNIQKGRGLPSFFLTLTCAEFYWKPLRRLLELYLDQSLDTKQKMYVAVKENPHIVTTYFDIRVKCYFKTVMTHIFSVTSYWFAYEFARTRGMIHLHGLCWRKDRQPSQQIYEAIQDGASEQELADIVADWAEKTLRLTASHPAGSDEDGNPRKDLWPPPEGTMCPLTEENNPLFKLCSETSGSPEEIVDDVTKLANTVCMHRCSGYCQKKNRRGEKSCRMEFGSEDKPGKELRKENALTLDRNCSLRLEMKRDHPMMTQFSENLVRSWRANCDLSVILSKGDPDNPPMRDIIPVSNYICRYATKGSQSSSALCEDMRSIATNADPESSDARKCINKLLMQTAKRDVTSVEASHELSGLPLYHCSEDFVKVSLGGRLLQRVGDSATRPHMIDKYIARPSSDKRSLYEFLCDFGVPVIQGNTYATRPISVEYAKAQLLLHYPDWRRIQDVIGEEEESILNKFQRFLCTDVCPNFIKADVKRALEWSDDLEEDDVNDDCDDEVMEQQDQPEWVRMLQPVADREDYTSDFQFDDGGDAHDWSSGPYPYIPNADEIFESLFSTSNNDESSDELDVPDVNLLTMNPQQRFAFTLIMYTLKKAISGDDCFIRLIISGKAGSGKSYLLNCVVNAVRRLRSSNGAVKVLCPTGNAASLVNGSTIHSTLKIPTNPRALGDMSPPSGVAGVNLQKNLAGTLVLLIDERSLIGCNLLGWMEYHCRCGLNSEKSWGGIPVVVFLGDDVQLPPVCDTPVYVGSSKFPASQRGTAVWKEFDHAIQLQQSMRQSEAEEEFREVLESVRYYRSSNDQVEWLQNFQWHKLLEIHGPEKMAQMKKDSLFVFPTHEQEWEHNRNELLIVNQRHPVAKVKAENTGMHAASAESRKTSGLVKVLYASVDSKVHLTTNVNVHYDLFNGAPGTVVDIRYPKGCSPKDSLPEYMLVDFPSYRGPAVLPDYPKLIPIPPVSRRIECSCYSCRRKQVPLRLGWGCTIHRCQGMSIGRGSLNRHIVIHPGSKKFESLNPGALYVALTRAKSSGNSNDLPDFAFNDKILLNADRICHQAKGKTFKAREKEINRICHAAAATKREFHELDCEDAFLHIVNSLPAIEE